MQTHRLASLIVFIRYKFVDASGTVARLGSGVNLQIVLHRHVVVLQRQVRWLIALVVGASQGDGRQQIEGNFSIGFRVFDDLTLVRRLELRVIRPAMRQRPGFPSAHGDGETAVDDSAVNAQ